MASEWGDRQNFFTRNLEYIASFNLVSRGHGGVQPIEATLQRWRQEAPDKSKFFHVLDDSTVRVGGLERDCPRGTVSFIYERLLLRAADGVLNVEGRLVLQTDDNAMI